MFGRKRISASRINIGCGTTAADGWLNIDKSPNAWLARHRVIRSLLVTLRVVPQSTRSANYRTDILLFDVHRKPLPVSDNSVDWVYTSHVIGSMTRAQALRLFCECYRVLRHGARLRVVTPDLAIFAGEWMRNIQAYQNHDRRHFADVSEEQPTIGDSFVRSMHLDIFTRANLSRLQRLFDYPVQYLYDFESLAHLLGESGFSRVECKGYRESAMPNVEILDSRPGSLHVEAAK